MTWAEACRDVLMLALTVLALGIFMTEDWPWRKR